MNIKTVLNSLTTLRYGSSSSITRSSNRINAESLPDHIPSGQPFSEKSLYHWRISNHHNGEQLLAFRQQRLNKNNLSAFCNKVLKHYTGHYESEAQLEDKIYFLFQELDIAVIDDEKLVPSGWIHPQIDDKLLYLLDRYLTCPDPIEFGILWLNDGYSLDQEYVYNCICPATYNHQPLFSNEQLSMAGLTQRVDDNSFQLVPCQITQQNLQQLKSIRRAQPVFHWLEQQYGMITPEKLEQLCKLLIPLSAPPLSYLLEPPQTAARMSEIAMRISKKKTGYPDELATTTAAYLEGTRSCQAIDEILSGDTSINSEPSTLLRLFRNSLQTNPTALVAIDALLDDIHNGQLSTERLNLHTLAILLFVPDTLERFAKLFCWLHRTVRDTVVEDDSSTACSPYLDALGKLADRMEQFRSHSTEITLIALSELPILLKEFTSAPNSPILMSRITQLYYLVSEFKNLCSFLPRESQANFSQNAQVWIEHYNAFFADRLVSALHHGIEKGGLVSPAALGLEQVMSTNWQTFLDSINDSDRLLRQFEQDRPRMCFSLLSESAVTPNQKPRHFNRDAESQLQNTDLERFIGDRAAAFTLSKLLHQGFASYPLKLEIHRLQQVCPLQLSPSQFGGENSQRINVTRLSSGDLSVEYYITTDTPTFRFGYDCQGKLALDRYRISATSTVSIEALHRKEVVATEPVVRIDIQEKKDGLVWYQNLEQGLTETPCPLTNRIK